jgi:large subunit ribosomal protein L6
MLTNSIIKNIEIPFLKSISFCFIKKTRILLLKTKFNTVKYFLIPKEINCSTTDNNLTLILNNNEQKNLVSFEQFSNLILTFVKNIENSTKKKLKLKGLGLKVNLSSNLKSIELKLGYSHLILVEIPEKDIYVSIQKNVISIEGIDPVKVGNFANKIRFLKIPDSYKGKGFWYKYEEEILKEVKKK